MSEGNDGYYFDQQAADDAAYEAYHAPAPAADINSLYQELLGRAPDPTGIAANAGASADTIRESILSSPEYNNQNVNTIYQDLLGRAPDPTGIAANAGATPEQIRQSIFGSAEYQNQAPPSGFFDMPGYGAENADPYSIVGNMLMQGNQLVYNVAPIRDDSGNISGYNRADTGEYVDLKTLNKSITGYDKEITDLYENLLGRAPDVSEVIAYNNQLKSGEVNLGDVYQGFMQSPERLNRVMPFLDPNADVNTKFEQGVRGFDAKGLSREGYLEGLPTHYVDPKTGKLAAWFGTLGDSMQTDDYTWHTVDELRAIPDAKVYLAQESKRDVGAEWRSLAKGAAMVAGTVLAPQLFAYLAPAAAAGGAGLTAAEAATLMGGTLSEAGAAATMGAGGAGAFSTGSALADAAIKNAVMNAGMTAIQGGKPGDILKAGVIGAVSGGAGSAIGDLGLGSLGTTLAKAGVQAGITGLTGGNVANSLIASAVGAALPVALDKIIPEGTFDGLPTLFKNALTSATARAVTAAATGGDISDAALNGIVGSAADAAMDYVAEATGFKGLTLKQAANKVDGYFNDVKANVVMGDYTDSQTYKDYIDSRSAGSSESDDGAGGLPASNNIFSRDTEEEFGAGAGDYVIANLLGVPTRIPVEDVLAAYQSEVNPNATIDDPGFQAALSRTTTPDVGSVTVEQEPITNPNAPFDSPFKPQLPASAYDPVQKALEDAGLNVTYKTLDQFTQDPGALVDAVYPKLAGRQPTAQERINFIDQYSNSNTTSPQDLLKEIYDQIQMDKQTIVYPDIKAPVTPAVTPPVTPVVTEPDKTKPTEQVAGGGGGGGTTGAPSPSAASTAAPSSALDQWFADNIVGEFEPIDYIAAPDGVKRELANKNYVDYNGYLTPRGRQILAGAGTGGVGSGGTGTEPGSGGTGGTGGGVGGGTGTGTGTGEGPGEGTGTGGGSGGGTGGGIGGGSGPGSGPGGTAAAKKAAAKKAANLRFNQSLNMALQSVQTVSAKTPPGAEIDYLYDIGGESIFAPMKGQSKYQPREDYYDPKIKRASGGIIDLLRSK